MPFSPEGYRALIEGFRGRGYEVRDFFSVERDARHLVLRHDIDVSLDAAVELAEIESSLGLRSTYFARVSGEFYNPAAPAGLAALHKLRALGHEVGLHFDAALVEDRLDALDAAAGAECAWLERLIEAPVRILSFHRPAQSLLREAPPLAGRANTYERRFFRELGYCSDSRGAFHHGEPLAHEAIAAGRALQLLTHPIWWVGPRSGAIGERLERFLASRDAALRQALTAEIASYGLAGGA